VTILNAFKEASEIALVLAGSLMLSSFEFGIFDVSTAMLAPVFWLFVSDVSGCDMVGEKGRSARVQLTVDFQYSDMSG